MRVGTFLAVLMCMCMVGAAPGLAEDTIKIGAILGVTGPASFLGAPEAKTLEMLPMRSTRRAASRV